MKIRQFKIPKTHNWREIETRNKVKMGNAGTFFSRSGEVEDSVVK